MEIQKTNLRNYDAQFIQAVRPETARSIKPNVFRDVPEEVQLALWLADLVDLSPEAKEILKKLGRSKIKNSNEIEWLALLEELEEACEKLEQNASAPLRGRPLRGSAQKDKNSRLNLIGLPVMRPPLPEVLFHQGNGRKRKAETRSETFLLLEAMIVKATDEGTKKGLVRELERLGTRIVKACKAFGVRIIVLGKKECLSDLRIHSMALISKGERTFDGRLKDQVRGMYFEDRRLIVIGEEQIGVEGHLTGVHEFAHAYDHTFSEKHHRMHHLSTQLWNLFSKGRTDFITAYASTKPAEYFAESVEAYFLPEKRPVLEKNDPQMFEFLSNLFLAG